MPHLIADASVSLAWGLPDEANSYADAALAQLETRALRVPSLWARELASGLAKAKTRGRVTDDEIRDFLALLSRQDIEVENLPPLIAIQSGVDAAVRLGLTAYDAAYVELALREGLPLATLDGAMRRAALKRVSCCSSHSPRLFQGSRLQSNRLVSSEKPPWPPRFPLVILVAGLSANHDKDDVLCVDSEATVGRIPAQRWWLRLGFWDSGAAGSLNQPT